MSDPQWTLGKLTRQRSDGSNYWSYCIIWRDDTGTRKRFTLATQDKVSAEGLARAYWASRQHVSAASVGEIMEAYLRSIEGTPSADRKGYAWAAARAYWAAVPPLGIDTAMSGVACGSDGKPTGYHAWRKRSVNTIRYELALIRTALLWAVGEGLLDKAPPIVVPAMPESETGHLSKPQFRSFLKGCKAAHVQLFAQLAVTTGARCAALLELRWEQVDLDRRIINLNPPGRVQRDNKRRAIVPVNDRLMPLLVEAKDAAVTDYVIEYKSERVLSIKKGIKLASERSGIHCTPHMFRHSAAVWMAEERVPMEEIAAYLGHKNTLITARVYARFNPDYLRRAASVLDW